MSEETDPIEEEKDPSRIAVVRKAVVVAILMFFVGIGLFIGIVIAIAKFASKTGTGPS